MSLLHPFDQLQQRVRVRIEVEPGFSDFSIEFRIELLQYLQLRDAFIVPIKIGNLAALNQKSEEGNRRGRNQ